MDNGELDGDVCPICKASLEDAKDTDVSKLSTKGVEKINKSSQERGCDDVVARPNQRVHKYTRNVDPRGQMIKQSHRL